MSLTIKEILFGTAMSLVLVISNSNPMFAENIQLAGGHADGTVKGPHAAVIDKRLRLLRAMGRANRSGDTATVVATAKSLQDASLWPAGSTQFRAKGEIWQNMSDFMAKFKAVETVAMAGTSGREMGSNCGACHRVYRGPRPGRKR